MLAGLLAVLLATPPWVTDLVYSAANYHGANAAAMIEVIRCETGGTFDPYIMNKNGLDHGIAQFRVHPNGYSLIQETPYATPSTTWKAVYDPTLSIYAMAWLWARGYASHWACYQMLYWGRVY